MPKAATVVHKKARTGSEQPEPPPVQRPRTEEREQDAEDKQASIERTRDRVEAFMKGSEAPSQFATNEGDQPPQPKVEEAAPVGGKEKKPEVQLPPEAVIGPEPVKPGELESDEQLEARLADIKPLNRDQEKHYGPLKQAIRDKHKLAEDWKKKAEDAEKKAKELEEKVLPEDEVKRLRSIEKATAAQSIEKLPRWQEYDKAVTEIESRAIDFLKTSNVVNDDILKAINDRGGLLKFSQSTDSAGARFKNVDGSQMTMAQYFDKFIYDKLDQRQKNRFDILTNEAEDKIKEKEGAIAKAREDTEGTLKAEGEQFWQKFNDEAQGEVAKLLESELPELGLPVQKPTIPATATAEEKKVIQELIDDWEEADKNVVPNTMVVHAKDRARVGFTAAIYPILKKRYIQRGDTIKDLEKRVEELQAFKDGIKNARGTLKKSAAITTPAEPVNNPMNAPPTEDRLASAGFR